MTTPVKRRVGDLACLGGTPCFERPLHVGRPNLGDRMAISERIEGVLDRRWLTNDGPCVAEFERRIAERLGVSHCVAMCNGTATLDVAARALGLTGEVIVPAFTFVATAHALQWQGITPVFCDIDPDTYTLDPAATESLVTERTSGIVGVHLWGRPCRIDELQNVADHHGLALLFDAAQAFGSSYRGTPLGRFGAAEILSFHATKVVNSVEGGALVTDDAELAERVRLMRSYGFVEFDEVALLGTNAKMNEISAAVGISSLDSLDDFVAVNQANFEAYREGLREIAGLRVADFEDESTPTYHYVTVEVDEGQSGLSRDALHAALVAENVLARRYFYPGCHRMEPYRTLFPGVADRLPVTERVAARALCLPTGQAIGRTEVDRICELIAFAVGHGQELTAALGRDREGPASPVSFGRGSLV